MTSNHMDFLEKSSYNATNYQGGGENMENLTGLGIFLGGLGLFFLSFGLFWFVSLYEKYNKSKQKEEKQ